MKLHQASGQGRNLFTGYGEGHVLINQVRHDGNLVVTPDEVLPWAPASFEELASEHFALLLDLTPEVVLFGSGARLRFPTPPPDRSPDQRRHRGRGDGYPGRLPHLQHSAGGRPPRDRRAVQLTHTPLRNTAKRRSPSKGAAFAMGSSGGGRRGHSTAASRSGCTARCPPNDS